MGDTKTLKQTSNFYKRTRGENEFCLAPAKQLWNFDNFINNNNIQNPYQPSPLRKTKAAPAIRRKLLFTISSHLVIYPQLLVIFPNSFSSLCCR